MEKQEVGEGKGTRKGALESLKHHVHLQGMPQGLCGQKVLPKAMAKVLGCKVRRTGGGRCPAHLPPHSPLSLSFMSPSLLVICGQAWPPLPQDGVLLSTPPSSR